MLGGQRLSAVTDQTTGIATVTMTLMQRPADYKLAVGFVENTTHLASSATAPFTVTPRHTTLTLAPLTVPYGGAWQGVATLDMGAGITFEQQTIFLLATGWSGAATGKKFMTSALTSSAGVASVGGLRAPTGTYHLTAYFAEEVPLLDGDVYDARNPRYFGSDATGELTIALALSGPEAPLPLGSSGTPVEIIATFADAGGTPTCTFDWHDGTTPSGSVLTTSSSCRGTHTYQSTGVFEVGVTASVGGVSIGEGQFQYVVIYDPNGGYVTGGGWIDSPEAAYAPDVKLVGRATFGFVSKYEKGATVPTGNTQFQFQVADLNFKSTGYDFLVIAGAKAQYKGVGTINGSGSFRFMLVATDGQVSGGDGFDRFRMRIWDAASGDLIYDNQLNAPETADPTTKIGGGVIVVHKAK
jgi:hypothetical protein